MSEEFADALRLDLIVKAFLFCVQELDEAEISEQFRYETHRRPDRAAVRAAIAKAKK